MDFGRGTTWNGVDLRVNRPMGNSVGFEWSTRQLACLAFYADIQRFSKLAKERDFLFLRKHLFKKNDYVKCGKKKSCLDFSHIMAYVQERGG